MKFIFKYLLAASALLTVAAAPVEARMPINLNKMAKAGAKLAKAATLSDAEVAGYAKESVDWMDTHNKVSDPESEYAKRLNRLTEGLKDANGIPLNFKVYEVIDVNAFACPDGSVRVFSSLMDIMSDDELLGVIGHEIGHVAKRHSKKAFEQSLLTGALRDGISSAGGVAAKLSDSDLGNLGEALSGAKFSQKQEKEADDAGYEFLLANGKNPWGMIMAFEKLISLEGESAKSSYMQRMFSSHPETKDRIARLSKRCADEGIERPQE